MFKFGYQFYNCIYFMNTEGIRKQDMCDFWMVDICQVVWSLNGKNKIALSLHCFIYKLFYVYTKQSRLITLWKLNIWKQDIYHLKQCHTFECFRFFNVRYLDPHCTEITFFPFPILLFHSFINRNGPVLQSWKPLKTGIIYFETIFLKKTNG